MSRVIQSSQVALTPAVYFCLSKSLQTLSLHSALSYFDKGYLLLQVIAMSVYCFHVLCRIKRFQVQVHEFGCVGFRLAQVAVDSLESKKLCLFHSDNINGKGDYKNNTIIAYFMFGVV